MPDAPAPTPEPTLADVLRELLAIRDWPVASSSTPTSVGA
jgi:hypothetical protein